MFCGFVWNVCYNGLKVIKRISMVIQSYYKTITLSLGMMLGVTTVLGMVLASSRAMADDDTSTVDEVNITVPVACSMSGTGMDSHTAEIVNGTYQANIGTTTIKAFCNDNAGFAIYAAGYTGNEVGGTNSNKLVGATTNQTIVTGTATSAGSSDVSNWAMKLGTITGTSPTYPIIIAGSSSDTNKAQGDPDFSDYTAVPNEYAKVAYRTSSTDTGTNAEGATLTTTYAAYVSRTQQADAYAGQVIYTLVHPYTESAPVACKPSGTTIGTNNSTDIVCMQDFASLSNSDKTTMINSMTTGTQYTLKDKRDGKEYKIAKLADGKVWMTQNLDLDLDAGTTYTNLDTDLGWNTSTNQYDTASWSPIRSTYATATNNIHEWCQGGTWNSQYGFCENNNTPESYDPGDLYWNTEINDWSDWDAYYNSCDYSTITPSCDESLNPLSTYVSSTGTQQYHLGNYYNWPAAIASNDASIYGAYNETTGQYENLETHQSICPAGWTLPYSTWNDNLGQSEGDFAGLWSEYGWTDNDGFSDISTVWSAPLYFAPAGYFNGNLGTVGNDGYFWSSVAGNGSYARYAYFSVGGGTSPAEYYNRNGGDSVRCLLR